METQGVTTVSYKADEFPAFFTSKSGIKPQIRMDSTKDIAKTMFFNQKLGLNSGILVGVPVPTEEEANNAEISKAIEVSLREAKFCFFPFFFPKFKNQNF